jgi:hypothetical protein
MSKPLTIHGVTNNPEPLILPGQLRLQLVDLLRPGLGLPLSNSSGRPLCS